MKRVFKIFKSHEEQDKFDERYYKRLSPDKKILELEYIRNRYIYYKFGSLPRLKRVSPGKRVEALEKIRLNYLRMKYGRVPRLRRVYKIIKPS